MVAAGPVTVTLPVTASTTWRSLVVPTGRTFQPSAQLVASTGMTSTEALRLIASLRAKISDANASEAAPLTRVETIRSRIAGMLIVARMAMMRITNIASTSVNPSARAFFTAPSPPLVDAVDHARLGAGAGQRERAVDGLAGLRRPGDGEGERRPGVYRDGDFVEVVGALLVAALRAVVPLGRDPEAAGAEDLGVVARIEQVRLLFAGNVHHHRLGVGALAAPDIILVGRPGNGGQDGDDGDHHHQLDERESPRAAHEAPFS